MIHDMIPPEHKCAANFIFDGGIIPSDQKTKKDLMESFDEFIKSKVNVFPYEKFSLSLHIEELSALYVLNLKNSDIMSFSVEIYVGQFRKISIPSLAVISHDGEKFTLETQFSSENDRNIINVYNFFAAAIMIINSQHVERDYVRISEKLNKSRAKSGKPPLNDYIVIKLTNETKRKLCETINGEKVFRRPHWRRGHLRHLGDGRIVPVSACIVNFNGDKVDPKTYIVKK